MGTRITRVEHDCHPLASVRPETFEGVARVVLRWRCPECGQRWRVVRDSRGGRAERSMWGGVRWSWRRAAAREVENRTRMEQDFRDRQQQIEKRRTR